MNERDKNVTRITAMALAATAIESIATRNLYIAQASLTKATDFVNELIKEAEAEE